MKIKNKMVLMMGTIILLTGVISGWMAYHQSVEILKHSIGEQTRIAAMQALEEMDHPKYEKILTQLLKDPSHPDNVQQVMKMDEYADIRDHLIEIRKGHGLKYLYTVRLLEDGSYVYVVDGLLEDPSLPGEKEDNYYEELNESYHQGTVVSGILSNNQTWGALVSTYVPIKNQKGEVIGIIGADYDATSVYNGIQKSKAMVLISVFLILIISMGISFLLMKKMFFPLTALMNMTDVLKEGDFTKITSLKGKDEIGILSRHFVDMSNRLKQMIQKIKQEAGQLQELSFALTKLSDHSVMEVDTIQKEVRILHQKGNDQIKIIEETQNKMNLMMNKITSITEETESVFHMSGIVNTHVQKGEGWIDKTIEDMTLIQHTQLTAVASMEELKNKSKEIEDIVLFIGEIAKHTNVLAFNATVEAKGAGKEGTGFAVIASEVKNLSNQSAKAAENISFLLKDIQAHIEQVVEFMNKTTDSIQHGSDTIVHSKNSFEEITRYIKDINNHLGRITHSSEQLSLETQSVSDSMKKTHEHAFATSKILHQFSDSFEKQKTSFTQQAHHTNELAMKSEEIQQASDKFRV